MQPLNQSERRKAFINFLLFFVVTITVIITVVFFSIQVPFSYNRQLRQELSLREQERELAQGFGTEMQDAVKLLKALEAKDLQPEFINAQLDTKLNKMNAMLKGVPEPQNSFYLSVIEHLAVLKGAKNDIRVLNGKEKNTAELKNEIQQLKAELMQKDAQLMAFQAQMRQIQ